MKNIFKFLNLSILLAALAMFSCGPETPEPDPEPFEGTPYVFDLPAQFPSIMNIPEDNPLTTEGVELGRYLFYDGRLAGRDHPDSLMSCFTCHRQERAFDVGMDHPVYTDGFPRGMPSADFPNGKKTPHACMSLVNIVFNFNGYLWNGLIHESNTNLGSVAYGVPAESQYHMKNIESLVWMGICAEHEMNGSIEKTVAMIQSIPGYKPLFKAAFGTEEITYERISKSIAQFIRTLVSSDCTINKYLRGVGTITQDQLSGFVLFETEEGGDCFHCHGTGNQLFTTNKYYNNAKDSVFTGVNEDPRDRYHVTGDPKDYGAYRAPSLVNCEHTAPYMHDGRYTTLEEIIDFYSEGLIYSIYADPLMEHLEPPYTYGVHLAPFEKMQLKAFLLGLTDDDFLTNPEFSAPASLP